MSNNPEFIKKKDEITNKFNLIESDIEQTKQKIEISIINYEKERSQLKLKLEDFKQQLESICQSKFNQVKEIIDPNDRDKTTEITHRLKHYQNETNPLLFITV